MKNYDHLPQDIRKLFEAVTAYGSACDKVSKVFRDKALEKFVKLLLRKYKVREIAKMFAEKAEKGGFPLNNQRPWKYYRHFAERVDWVFQRGWRERRVRYWYNTKEIERVKF